MNTMQRRPSADPAVAALLGQADQRQADQRQAPKERQAKAKERRKMKARLPGRLTADITAELKDLIERQAASIGTPASQYARMLIIIGLNHLDDIDIHAIRTPSSSPRYTWNLDLDEIQENTTKGIP